MTRVNFQDENLLRELTPQVLAAVIRRFGDFAAAEDAVQEALLAATLQWPQEGVPANPRGWLIQVASRRMKDHIRAEIARRRREDAASAYIHADEQNDPTAKSVVHYDDTLILLMMCCHPALTRTSAIALTLRAVGGLTTAEIANAYFVPETTMAQRISRAKQLIKASGIPFQIPHPKEHSERLTAVLHVLYLIFNEGYASSTGSDLLRHDLSREAIRLARLVQHLLPEHKEAAGLLALMLLTDARRAARTGANDEAIPLAEQDRTKWDRQQIAEGISLLTATLSKGEIGPYQLQAAIAAVHDEATKVDDTDWPQILTLYKLLGRMVDNPMIMLNYAVAEAMVHGPHVGLKRLEPLDLDKRLTEHYRLDVVRAHLHEMLGDTEKAIHYYRLAAGKTASIPEKQYLAKKLAKLIPARRK